MTTAEEQLQCFYLDASSQNASAMLRKCVQDRNSEFEFNCNPNSLKKAIEGESEESRNIRIQENKDQMNDEELSYYVKRLRSKHKRLTTKWFGMRRKHGKDECPYCGSFTGGGFCIMHQRDYDEYMTAEVMLMNRSFME